MLHHLGKKLAHAAYMLLNNKFACIYQQLYELEMPNLIMELDKYLKQLSITGFNSSKYNINSQKLCWQIGGFECHRRKKKKRRKNKYKMSPLKQYFQVYGQT